MVSIENIFHAVITTAVLLDGSLDLFQIKCIRGMTTSGCSGLFEIVSTLSCQGMECKGKVFYPKVEPWSVTSTFQFSMDNINIIQCVPYKGMFSRFVIIHFIFKPFFSLLIFILERCCQQICCASCQVLMVGQLNSLKKQIKM